MSYIQAEAPRDPAARAWRAGRGQASPAAPPPPGRLPMLHQTTRDLPPARQFEAWCDANAGLVEYRRPERAPASYEVDATTWRFGGLALMLAETPPGRYRRSATGLRRDGMDLLSLSMALHGGRVYRSGDEVRVMRPGRLVLHSLGQPFETARGRSGWLHLYLPREAAPEAAELAGGCLALDMPAGLLLRDYLLLLARELPRMTAAEAEPMAAATRAMISLAACPDAARHEAAGAPVAAVQLARLRGLVRAHIGSATLGPARLSRLAGISRSRLYRLLDRQGGVSRFIQRERLAAAHRALSDAAERRSIAAIAESVGLFDPSSFSRMFRRSFGLSPRELRLSRSAGVAAAPAWPPGGGAISLADMLGSL